MQNLLPKNLKDETDIVVSHDVLNKSIWRQKSNNYRPLSLPDLINVMKTLQDKLNGRVYCRRYNTLDIIISLKKLREK